MATEKSAAKKVMDVSHPGKVAASASSRPLIVTNRPLIAQDPMMASDVQGAPEITKPAEKVATTTEVTPRAAKVIKPLSGEDKDAAATTAPAVPSDEDVSTDTDTDSTSPAEQEAAPADVAADEKPATREPEETPTLLTTDEDGSDDKQVNPEAVKLSEEDTRRNKEIEEIIASGRYYVPVNSHAKRRTRIVTFWLVTLMVVLAAVLVNALLDVGILNFNVPHTHFFSAQ